MGPDQNHTTNSSAASFAFWLTILLWTCTAGHAVDRYVSLEGGHVAPFMNWADAATNIQAAIDAADPGDLIWVTNGVYRTGGKVKSGDLTNRVALDKPLTVRSVNGPAVTTIEGAGATNGLQAIRCVWLTNGAMLMGFTVQGGATRTLGTSDVIHGGGVWCATNALVVQCVIRSNTANLNGGGAYQGQLRNCLLTGNMSPFGAGAYSSVLNSCTVVSNSGAAIRGSPIIPRLTNCIVYFNTINSQEGIFSYCCTTPMRPGEGNLSAPPQFLPGGVHLANASPCRGAGTNLVSGTDIDGQPWADPPSIGCTEWQPKPVLVSQPTIRQVRSKAEFTVGVTVNGEEPMWFGWTRNGVPIEDGADYRFAHTTNLNVLNASLMLEGRFQVVASNAFGMVTSAVAQLTVYCVDAAGNMPVVPYTSWATAATNIQDAIDAAPPGGLVLVTNGVYYHGGKVKAGDLTNRVALDKAILVHSVNGPAVTVIQGQWDPATTNGPGAVRCAWLTNGATLSGFTLQGGATRDAGDSFTLQAGGGVWCGTTEGTVRNCVIADNSAQQIGAGAYYGWFESCLISNNVKFIPNSNGGGGAAHSVLVNCFITGNNGGSGGGVYQARATNCVLIRNVANRGGGAFRSTLVNCTVTENKAAFSGGGATWGGGGSLINCTLWNNGAGSSSPNHSEFLNGTMNYSCTTPLTPFLGNGNISTDPQLLADGVHLAATSPCRGVGNPLAAMGADIDGQIWASPPSMGCDEWFPEPIIALQPRFRPARGLGRAQLSVEIAGQAPFFCTWNKDGAVLQDGGKYSLTGTSDVQFTGVGLEDSGGYQVIVSNAFGVSTSSVVPVGIHCADAASLSPMPPYASWETASTNIQTAIKVADPGDVVLVADGIYDSGGKTIADSVTNRIALDKAVLVMSVNGPETTIIEGQWDPVSTNGPAAVRCAWMTDYAGLSGFTLRKGAIKTTGDVYGGGVLCSSTHAELANCVITNCYAGSGGGGVSSGTLENCRLVGNAALFGGGAHNSVIRHSRVERNTASWYGGGVSGGSVFNSWLNGNSAVSRGGGSMSSTLVNCTVTGNSASLAGGCYTGLITNSIVYFNFAPTAPNIVIGLLANSCTTEDLSGAGNISIDPQLTDGLHLAAGSPCRGMGSSLAVSGTDFEGDHWANPPSIGCDEVSEASFVGPLTVSLSTGYPETAAYGVMPFAGQVTGRASYLEWSFGDGNVSTNLSDLTSYTWTNPGDYTVTFTAFNADHPAGVSTNLMVKVLPLLPPLVNAVGMSGTNFSLSFAAQPGVSYLVEQTTNLVPPVAWELVRSIRGEGELMQVVDTRATNTMKFYRVRTP